MPLEVEQKFRVHDLAATLARLHDHGIEPGEAICQRDDYFNHPAKDFAITDEALRIRSVGDENRVTYKGPRRSQQTKTRREIEFSIGVGSAGRKQLRELLLALGFRPVATVEKQRRVAHAEWQGLPVEIAVDHVAALGDFIELEFTAPESDFSQTEQALLAMSQELDLDQVERRSYLEMLLTT